jgi:hypothetical protein
MEQEKRSIDSGGIPLLHRAERRCASPTISHSEGGGNSTGERILDIDPRGWIYPDRFGRAVKDNARRNTRFYPAAIHPPRFAYPMRASAARLRESGRQERSYP